MKEKLEMNNIYGGVHGSEREKQIRIIDKRLGIDDNQFNAKRHSASNSKQLP